MSNYCAMTDVELCAELRAEATELTGTQTAEGLLSSARLIERNIGDELGFARAAEALRNAFRAQAIGQLRLLCYVRQDLKGRAA